MHERNLSTLTTARRELFVDRRFEGFPGIANGGYLAGLFHRELGGSVEVTLRRPTPVDVPLWLERPSARAAELSDASGPLATALRAEPAIEVPPPVGFDSAIGAGETYRGRSEMPIASCFVCGVARSPADGLRLHSGELAPGRIAAAWVPGPAFGDLHGDVLVEYAVAALDCPGAWAIASVGARFREPMVLGRLWVRCLAPVRVGLPHVVVGSATGEEGRKRFATTAIYGPGGHVCASARSIWFPRT
jgi:hypothetical protein